MNKDIAFDFKNKIIYFTKEHKDKKYTVQEFYSFIQDTFDEPENMCYDLPIESVSKGEFKLVNGWIIDKEGLKHLKGKIS